MKKWFSLVFVSAMVVSLFVTPSQAFLDGASFTGVAVSEKNSVRLSWNDVGDNYKIYLINDEKGDKFVWSGSKKTFTVQNLKSDQPYIYRVEAYVGKKKINEIVMHTSTLKNQQQIAKELKANEKMFSESSKSTTNTSKLNYEMVDSNINTVVGSDHIKIIWSGIPDEDGVYDIYRNGDKIDTVKGDTYVDENINKNEVYQYNVIGRKKLPAEEINKIKKALGQKEKSISKKQEEKLFYEKKVAGTIIRFSTKNAVEFRFDKENQKGKKIDKPSISSMNWPVDPGYWLRYSAFIPMDKEPNPYCEMLGWCEYEEFSGDNRGFDLMGTSFRARTDTFITYNVNDSGDITPNDIEFYPQTGETIGYRNGEPVEIGKAAESDMEIRNIEYGDNYVYHRMFMASQNPLLEGWEYPLTPDIDAFYYAKVFQDGRGEFYGVHDQAPSHEFYFVLYWGAGSDFWEEDIVEVHTQEHVDFEYLFPFMPKTEFDITVSL